MISAVQQQQASQAAIAVSIGSASSCIQHLPNYRWHVHFGDFEAICGHAVSADCLRAFETMTDARIAQLRESAGIPTNRLPHEDDLWIEASTPDIDFWTLHVRDQSTYWYCLQEESWPGRAKSLLELGFLRRRFVAYPGRYAIAPVATTIYLDVTGNPFIIVDDDKQGYYVGVDGELHSAADEGYAVMRRQYLCCFNVINTALTKLAGQSPPKPMLRWHSLQKTQRKGTTEETTKSTLGSAQFMTSQQQTSAAQGCLDDEIKDNKAGSTLLFADKYNISDTNLSLENTENRMSVEKLSNNSVPLHSAPWSPETCVALSAQINHELFALSAYIDEATYNRDWLEPAQRLIEKRCTDFAEPSRAWERIELHVWAMLPGGPTWYGSERTEMTPFTLRHVEKNWKTVETELRKKSWPVYDHIDYTGPSIFDEQFAQSSSAQPEQSYAQGYTAQPVMTAQGEEETAQSDAHYVESTAQILEVTAQSLVVEVVAGDMQNDDCAVDNEQSAQSVRTAQGEEETAQSLEVEDAQCAMQTETTAQTEQSDAQLSTTIVRRKRRTPGMLRGFADTLFDQVSAAHPLIKLRMIKLVTGFYEVSMQLADEQWYAFERFSDWEDKSPEIQRAIDAAERYAQQRNAAQSNDGHTDSQGPPGYGEVSEGGDE